MKKFTKENKLKVQYYRIKKGEILDNQGKPTEFVKGKLVRIWLKYDLGNPQHGVKPHKVLQVNLMDDDGSISVVCIPQTSKIGFCYLAYFATTLPTDTDVAFTTNLGNSGVTFVDAYVYNSDKDDWDKTDYVKSADTFDNEIEMWCKNIPSHNLYSSHKTEMDKEESRDF